MRPIVWTDAEAGSIVGITLQRVMYDRRGRGSSGDTKPYAKEHELEDIDIDSSLAMLVAGSIRWRVGARGLT